MAQYWSRWHTWDVRALWRTVAALRTVIICDLVHLDCSGLVRTFPGTFLSAPPTGASCQQGRHWKQITHRHQRACLTAAVPGLGLPGVDPAWRVGVHDFSRQCSSVRVKPGAPRSRIDQQLSDLADQAGLLTTCGSAVSPQNGSRSCYLAAVAAFGRSGRAHAMQSVGELVPGLMHMGESF
jgi:hypothetical protein